MPYSYITWGGLKDQLSARLADTAQTFWVSAEIELLMTEALRTLGLCTGFWRERGTLASSTGVAFYDINTLLYNGSEYLLAPTVTDRDIIKQIQYALLESASSQTSWTGTEMFTYNDISKAITNRRNQFSSDTGIVVSRSLINILPPPASREILVQDVVDLRRMAWLGASPENYYKTMWRDDERMLTAYQPDWSVDPGTPSTYSIMATPPLRFQIAPPPISTGQIELLTVNSVTLDPANSATILGIPDDLTPAIKWGALADLLGIDGIASDPTRAAYCESRYMQYVQLARALPVVIHAEINGLPLIPSTLAEMDASTPNWQNIASGPTNPVADLLLVAPNMIALSAVPSTRTSVTLDVVRRTPIPATDLDDLQLGREQLDMAMDYAEHLALFKVGGAEWHATERQGQNFMMQAVAYNQRLSAAARAALSASMQSQRQKQEIPRRLNDSAMGVGALQVQNG